MIPLGPFDLIARSGRGGMGEVWRAVHRAGRVPVAVKVLTSAHARDSDYRSSFRNEVRAVAGLEHPNVIMVFDHGEVSADSEAHSGGRLTRGSPYLVMEWAAAGTLNDRTPMASWQELRKVLAHLLDALAHAHARGVVHRDLKPANVLVCGEVDRRPGLKLADFGIARPRDFEGELLFRAGTPAYMAPEQVRDEWRDQGPWTDLYALGCLTFKLATGSPPFRGRADLVLNAQLRDPVPALKSFFDVPEGLETWLLQLLEKDPARRFVRAADAAWALLQLDEPGVATSLRPRTSPAREGDEVVAADGSSDTIVESNPISTLVWLEDEATLPAPSNAEAMRVDGQALPGHPGGAVPPFDESWRSKADSSRSPRLLDAGLGLYGLRAIPLVGRERERDALWETLRRVHRNNEAEVVILQGPAGCGKTRLAEWLAERAHELGLAVVLRGVHGAMVGPAHGLGPMLARHLRCAGLGHAETLRRIKAALRMHRDVGNEELETLSEVIAPAGSERGSFSLNRSGERYVAVRRFLERLGRERPVVLWLDDAQWGLDSLVFVSHLMEAQTGSPASVLVVMTVRDEALPEQELAAALLRDLSARPHTTRVNVGPLSPTHRSSLVQELLGLSGPLAARIEERTAGNPLFAVQLVGDWVQREILVPGTGGFRLKTDASVELPKNLRHVWTMRINRVLQGHGASDGITLELAAILGPEVDSSEWRSVCGRAGFVASMRLVETLLQQRLARCDSEGPLFGWSFVHGMLRETFELRARHAGRWEDHHRICAAVLRDREGTRIAERVGRHLLAAGDVCDALEPLAEGIRERLHQSDYRQAEVLLAERDRAMMALPLLPNDPQWARGWLLQHRLTKLQGRQEAARELADRAEAAAREHGWERALAEALVYQGRLSVNVADVELAMKQLLEAQQIIKRLNDRPLTADCHWTLGEAYLAGGLLAEAELSYRRGLEEYCAQGNESGESTCWNGLAQVARVRGRLDDAQQNIERARDLASRTRYHGVVANCDNILGELARLRGDLDGAERFYRRSASAYRTWSGGMGVLPELNLGLILVERRRFGEAEPIIRQGIEEFERQGWGGMLGAAHTVILPCLADRGAWEAFDSHARESRALLEETGFCDLDAALLSRLAGDMCRDAGQIERARAAYALSYEQLKRLKRAGEAAQVRVELDAL